MTNPTTVLIAKEFVASTKVESLTPGQLTIVGAQKDVLTASDKTAFLALKKANGQVLFSPAIHAANIDVIEASAYIPPIEEQAIVDFTDADVFNGHEYVIRLVYKDIYDHPGQFTQTYRALLGVNSGSTPTVGDKVALAKKFVAAINRKDSYSPIDKSTSRITASQIAGGTDLVVAAKADLPTVIPADGTTAYAIAEDQIFTVTAGAWPTSGTAPTKKEAILLTSKLRTDAGDLYSINSYAQVNFEVCSWFVYQNGTFNYNNPYDAKIKYLETANPGKGQWRLVRDREKFGAAYKGNLNAKAWPATINSTQWYDLNTDPTKNYNTLTIISDQPYISVQAQYEEKAKYQTEVYIPSGATGVSALETAISGFLSNNAIKGKVVNTTGTANKQTVTINNDVTALS